MWTASTLLHCVDAVHYFVVMVNTSADEVTEAGRRRPRGAVRDGLLAAGVELARTGGPGAVVLREAARIVGVVPNAAYRHFADRDELLAAVCVEALGELAARMAVDAARVRGAYGDAGAARRRIRAIFRAYLEFAHAEPGLFATAFSMPHQHAYSGEVQAAKGPVAVGSAARGARRTGRRRRARPGTPRRDRIPHLVHGARAGSALRAGSTA